MGFFSTLYTKEGRGIRKDEPQKKGLARFFEILFRDFGLFFRLNFLMMIAFVPMAIVVFFTVLFSDYLGMILIGLAAFLLTSIWIGPCVLAMHAVIVKTVRDIPGFLWHDFKKGLKNSPRQSIPTGIVMSLFFWIDICCLWLILTAYPINVLLLAAILFGIFLITCVSSLMFLQILFIDLPLRSMLKNSVMILFGFATRTLPATLMAIAGFFAIAYFFPISVIAILIGAPTLIMLIVDMWLWPVMDQIFNITELQKEKEEKERLLNASH